ncbi:MAG TPA: GNVR domain-containing protein [Candidatus Kapabacteria bacterium]|nr:GNVR domain-containing protein [Candidatus Kapabacteria bacterium]
MEKEKQYSAPANGHSAPDGPGDVHVLDILNIFAKRKKFIVITVAICTAAVIVISYVMPHIYTTSLSILPPEKNEMNPLTSMLGGSNALSSFSLSSIGENHSSDFYLDVLKSRTLAESLFIDDPAIKNYFAANNPSLEGQILAFKGCLTIESEHDGLVKVEVDLPTHMLPSEQEQQYIAKLSAEIANGCSKELDRLSRLKVVSQAHNSRVFVESQLQATSAQMDSLSEAMIAFQKEYKVLALDKQVENEIKTAIDLKSQITELQLELDNVLHNQSPTSMEAQQLQARLAELRQEYDKLQYGGDSTDYYIPFPKIPTLQKTYTNMVLDLKVLEQVHAYLQNQYYQDRVQEERDVPVVQVLDTAPVPDHRSSPKRSVMLILGVIISTMLACGYVLVAEYFHSLPDSSAEHQRMKRFVNTIAPRSRYAKRLATENGNGKHHADIPERPQEPAPR